jgi:hypothetical protein
MDSFASTLFLRGQLRLSWFSSLVVDYHSVLVAADGEQYIPGLPVDGVPRVRPAMLWWPHWWSRRSRQIR